MSPVKCESATDFPRNPRILGKGLRQRASKLQTKLQNLIKPQTLGSRGTRPHALRQISQFPKMNVRQSLKKCVKGQGGGGGRKNEGKSKGRAREKAHFLSV
jgi:hypothetical protein